MPADQDGGTRVNILSKLHFVNREIFWYWKIRLASLIFGFSGRSLPSSVS